jgi:hypothetical protein
MRKVVRIQDINSAKSQIQNARCFSRSGGQSILLQDSFSFKLAQENAARTGITASAGLLFAWFSSQFLVATKTNWKASHEIVTTMTLKANEHSKPSPSAPYVPSSPYAPTAAYAVPVAVAVEAVQPVKASSLPIANNQGVTNVEIEFQPNTDLGIVFGADPLRVLGLTQPIPSLAREGRNIEGYYFHSLRLPGLEIKNVVHASELISTITANRHLSITLVVSSHPPPTNRNGCQYKHDLPATDNLGVYFSGFPAKIQAVDPNSPMAGKMHRGQSVYAVVVPGLADLTMQSGGFTGSRVAEHLQTHWHVPGKQIVITHQPILVQDRTSNGAFDDSCECISCKCISWRCIGRWCNSCCDSIVL